MVAWNMPPDWSGSIAKGFIAFTIETIADEEGDKQLSRKRRRFQIQKRMFLIWSLHVFSNL